MAQRPLLSGYHAGVFGRFRFSGPGSGASKDAWFRIGTVDVTTTVLLIGMTVLSFFIFALSPQITVAMALLPQEVRAGQLWRLASWPLANVPAFVTALNLFFFYLFGTQMEQQVGRDRFLRFLVLLTVIDGLLAMGLAQIMPPGPVLLGVDTLTFAVFLVYIAEHPHARLLFGIPAWVLGLVLVAIPVLQMLGQRDHAGLVLYLLSLVVAALLARGIGLLADYRLIPNLALRRPRQRRTGTVVAGPWQGTSSPISADRAEMDALLDKISSHGLDSLTSAERKRLMTLRDRLRGS